MRSRLLFWCVVVLLVRVNAADAQLRIATYNTLDKPTDSLDNGQFNTIFSAIAENSINGIAKRVDIIALQEQQRRLVSGNILDTSVNIAGLLNFLHGVTTYESRLIGSGVDRLAIVFDNSTVDLISNEGVDVNGTRPGQLAHFRPVGYSSPDADFYLYNFHLNASRTSTRNTEVNGLLADAEPLASGLQAADQEVNFIYAGDFNFGSSNETGYVRLTGSGPAEAIDPLNLPTWPSFGVARHLTQSTRSTNIGDGGATGGNDDRFDLQLMTADLLDGEGLTYIGPTSAGLEGLQHSYQAFGNDGLSYNTAINNTYEGRSQSPDVLDALHRFSDHLPLLADLQLPAVMEATIGDLPLTLAQGEAFELDVTVTNVADVLATHGADELDYMVTASGSVSGFFGGAAFATETGDTNQLVLDTATLGSHTGVIRITSSSEAVENGLLEFPVSYEVVASMLAGDFNEDGAVTALDYTVWRDGLATGDYQLEDYELWRAAYVAAANSAAPGAAAIPEPTTWYLLLVGVVGGTRRIGKRAA